MGIVKSAICWVVDKVKDGTFTKAIITFACTAGGAVIGGVTGVAIGSLAGNPVVGGIARGVTGGYLGFNLS